MEKEYSEYSDNDLDRFLIRGPGDGERLAKKMSAHLSSEIGEDQMRIKSKIWNVIHDPNFGILSEDTRFSLISAAVAADEQICTAVVEAVRDPSLGFGLYRECGSGMPYVYYGDTCVGRW